MQHAVADWFHSRRLYLMLGVGVWGLIAGVAAAYAARLGLPVLPTVVTWDEWVVAVLVFPWLGAVVMGAVNAMRPSARMAGGSKRAMGVPYLVAGVVFVLDLLTRALFGLGWQPFL